MKPSVTLIYFKGCPRASDAIQAVESAGVNGAKHVIQDELSASDPRRRYSSPSILVGEKVIYGGTQEGTGACSWEPIEKERIANLLLGALA